MFCSFVVSNRAVVHTGKGVRCVTTVLHVYAHVVLCKDTTRRTTGKYTYVNVKHLSVNNLRCTYKKQNLKHVYLSLT